MKVKIKALDHFTHGRVTLSRGTEHDGFTKMEAEELAKKGLVEIIDGAPQGDVEEDLIGTKEAPEHDNKMAAKPSNKSKRD
jgi:hypothetical protein